MNRRVTPRSLRRPTAGVVLTFYLAGCTHMPSGQKAFDSFEQCVAANLGVAAAGGTGVGALGAALARRVTGASSTATQIGVTAGVAAAVMIGLAAWKKCAAVYSTSERVDAPQPAPAAPPAAVAPRRPGLEVERLDVRVEGSENDPPIPEFSFSYVAANPAAKDIKARFRHKVEIVRFKADDNDRLILVDTSGDPLLDAGRPLPLEAAMRMPRERLSWVPIAEEGRDDYVEDVVIQQSQHDTFRHKLQIPPRAQLPLPLPVPMRYTVTIEVEGAKSSRTVDFALLGTGERPKRYSAIEAAHLQMPPVAPATVAAPAPARGPERPAPASAPARASPPASAPPRAAPAAPAPGPAAPALSPAAPTPPQPPAGSEPPKATVIPGFAATHKVKRAVALAAIASTSPRVVGRIAKDTPVRVEERGDLTVDRRAVPWALVTTADGLRGWVPAADLEQIE